MILILIINILAIIGFLTLALIALALWAFVSDEEDYDGRIISDEEVLALKNTIPTRTSEEATAT